MVNGVSFYGAMVVPVAMKRGMNHGVVRPEILAAPHDLPNDLILRSPVVT